MVLLYAAPIWSQAMQIELYKRYTTTTYRIASIRVTRAFCRVLYEAVYVISGKQIELVIDERSRIYCKQRKDPNGNRRLISKEEQLTSVQWQKRWDAADTGR